MANYEKCPECGVNACSLKLMPLERDIYGAHYTFDVRTWCCSACGEKHYDISDLIDLDVRTAKEMLWRKPCGETYHYARHALGWTWDVAAQRHNVTVDEVKRWEATREADEVPAFAWDQIRAFLTERLP